MLIYIVTQTNFNNRDKDRFGIDYFLKENFKVIVLSVQDYTNPELRHLLKPEYASEVNLEVIYCKKFDHIKSIIDKKGIGIALLFISDNYQSIKIRNYLQKNNVRIGIVHAGMLPSIIGSGENNISSRIMKKVKSLNIIEFVNFSIYKLYFKLFNTQYYDFFITSNYQTSIDNFRFPPVKNIIETHSLDYDLVLRYQNEKSIINGKYVVFLDQYLLDHSDFLRYNMKLNISKEKYYKELNIFFDLIEKQFNYQVVIAAHPRADIDNYRLLFNHRKIVYGQSGLLVKYSEFTMTHYSTAISFAVIYKKPVLFITNDEIKENSYLTSYIEGFSKYLNQNIINTSLIKQLPANINIDIDKYSEYKKKYIKNNNLEILSWEIFYHNYIKSYI